MTLLLTMLSIQATPMVTAAIQLDWAGKGELLVTVEGPDEDGPAWKFDPSKIEVQVQGNSPKPKLRGLWAMSSIYSLPTQASRKFRWIGKLQFDRLGAFPGWYTATASIDRATSGLRGKSVHGSKPFRFYVPDEDSKATLRLRNQWIGKKVWIRGASAVTSSGGNNSWDPRLPATIVDIKRGISGWERTGTVPLWSFGTGWGPEPTVCFHPLLVSLRLPKTAIHHISDGIGDDGPVYDIPFTDGERWKDEPLLKTQPKGELGSIKVADEWQLQRMATTDSPEALFVGAPPGLVAEFAKRKISVGMTREMVARILGYPSNREVVAELQRKQVWQYPGPGSLAYKVVFSSAGLVVKAGMIGSLP